MYNQYQNRSINSMRHHMDSLGDSTSDINNMFTTGYKSTRRTFHETVNGMRETVYRDFRTGTPKKTDRNLDFAIDGIGFFEVELPDGTTAYTRDGSFRLGPNGELLSSQGYPLLNKNYTDKPEFTGYDNHLDGKYSMELSNTDLVIPLGSNPKLDDQGGLFTDEGKYLGKISVVTFPNIDGLKDIGNGLFVAEPEAGTAEELELGYFDGDTKLRQGALESANSSIVNEMANINQLNSAIKADMKIIKVLDSMQETLNSTITRNM